MFSLFFDNTDWLWLNPEDGSVVERFEVRNLDYLFNSDWISGPILAGDHFYNLDFQSVIRRSTSDNSLEKWQFFRNLGYYRSSAASNLIEMIALDDNNDDLCSYVTIDILSGETKSTANGFCSWGEDYYGTLYLTSSIQKSTGQFYDAIYLTESSAYIYYQGTQTPLPVCEINSSLDECICYGSLYYNNRTAAIVSQFDGEVRLDVFDMDNDMNHTTHVVLEKLGLIKSIDVDNVLVHVPVTTTS